MPDRLLLALIVAASFWSLSTNGNAQVGAPGMRGPLSPAGSARGPYATAPGGQDVRVAYPPGAVAAQPGSFGESSAAAADPSRKLQSGDQLLYKIEQDHEGAVAVMVSTTGDVAVEPLPQTVRVAGLTLPQAANEIKRLLEKDYYYTATVRLSLERASNPVAGSVNVDGDVNRRGPLPLYEGKPLKLSQAINMCGGFTNTADQRKVKVTRVNKDGTTQVFYPIDVKAIVKDSRVEKDILLKDGDYIFVERNFFLTN